MLKRRDETNETNLDLVVCSTRVLSALSPLATKNDQPFCEFERVVGVKLRAQLYVHRYS